MPVTGGAAIGGCIAAATAAGRRERVTSATSRASALAPLACPSGVAPLGITVTGAHGANDATTRAAAELATTHALARDAAAASALRRRVASVR